MLKILAVDISNLFRRSWEASQGKEFSAAFNRTVEAVARYREGHDRVAICCDGGTSYRKAISGQYKANRTDAGAPYHEQLRQTIERLEKDACSIFRAPLVSGVAKDDGSAYSAEADDVIGALTAWARERGDEVTILSMDKDLCQLIGEGVRMLRPDSGDIWGPEQIKEKYGVTPEQIPDFLALAGDASDGYKPYRGIAETRAAALLQACGSAMKVWNEDNLARLDQIVGPANAKTLKDAGPEPADRALQLALIMRKLDLDFSPLIEEPKMQPITETVPAEQPQKAETQLAVRQSEPAAMAQVVRAPKSDPWNLQPTGAQGLLALAHQFVEARCFPNVANPAQVIAVTVIAQNLGVPMGIAMNHAYFVHGRLSWSASFIMGLVRRSPDCEKFFVSETTPTHATVTYKRRGEPQNAYTFKIQQARDAGWVKGGGQWDKRPDVMCRWAAIREAARMVWGDVVAGLYMPDEITNGEVPDEQWKRDAA